jgi:hypothetical protein
MKFFKKIMQITFFRTYPEFVIIAPILLVFPIIYDQTENYTVGVIQTVVFYIAIVDVAVRTAIAFTNLFHKSVYVIKKGRHYSSHGIRLLLFPKSCQFRIKLTGEEFHDGLGIQVREQWNKMGGVSFGLLGRNSARIAYRIFEDKVQIVPYLHIGGEIVVSESQIKSFYIGDIIDVDIQKTKDSVLIGVNDKLYSYPMFCIPIIGYRQYPYFGGKAPAPNNITINLEFIK